MILFAGTLPLRRPLGAPSSTYRLLLLLERPFYWRLGPCLVTRAMKRKAVDARGGPKPKRPREALPDYCDTETQKDDSGTVVWPAPQDAIEGAREFIRNCAASERKILVVPDKDADGLCSGAIVHRTLTALGLPPASILVHFVEKGASVHDEAERKKMQELEPGNIIVVDQGSRAGPPLVEDSNVKSLVIDHHLSDNFPEKAQVYIPSGSAF
ncbi:MAG: hypothetical protein Q9190_003282 [Brigantiaea leucoxantha]